MRPHSRGGPPRPLVVPDAVLGDTPAPPPDCYFVTVEGQPLHLEHLYRGASLFLLLTGPSLADLDLGQLRRRGIVTMGVNQSPSLFRTDLWVHVDRPRKFHDGIWRDPGVLKFVPACPLPFQRRKLLAKLPDGTFAPLRLPGGTPAAVGDMPGVVGYRRNATFRPGQWLSEGTINWGNDVIAAGKNGHPHCLNVMFAALKVAYVLGFRTVYLLGCDFQMVPEAPYAFAQRKSRTACARNVRTYRNLNTMLGLLKNGFDKFRYLVYNCKEGSGLTVFPYKPFMEAVGEAAASQPPEPWDVRGWYDATGPAR